MILEKKKRRHASQASCCHLHALTTKKARTGNMSLLDLRSFLAVVYLIMEECIEKRIMCMKCYNEMLLDYIALCNHACLHRRGKRILASSCYKVIMLTQLLDNFFEILVSAH